MLEHVAAQLLSSDCLSTFGRCQCLGRYSDGGSR